MSGSALTQAHDALVIIDRRNDAINAFVAVRREQALSDAALTDESGAARSVATGSLAGTCFAVKDLFDVGGEVTRAGSVLLDDAPPAARDAFVVERLRRCGATLVGRLNMDEFAYGFSTENAHFGTTRNPYDESRIAGGSSGGSAAAVAAGMVPLALGSDTNGSIRIPAALCGIYGLKPTFGRLSRGGTFPFVASLDHVGPMAATLEHLAHGFDAMQGYDPQDPVAVDAPRCDAVAALGTDAAGRNAAELRVSRLGGWFGAVLTPEVRLAYESFLATAGITRACELDGSREARSAAYCLSAAEGGQLHLDRLRRSADLFDPATRDRLLAGALMPAATLVRAQRLRAWYRGQALRLFEHSDVLVAPATFTTAPRVGQGSVEVDGATIPVLANLGLYTQPLSFIGLPVLTIPIPSTGLPIGVQIVAKPWREDLLFALAAHWVRAGLLGTAAEHR